MIKGDFKHSIKDKEICDLYLSGKSLSDILLKTGTSKSNIYRTLQRNNISTNRTIEFYWEKTKTYSINDSFFEKIDTQEKAYILGFLYADGSLSSTPSQLRLKIADVDMLKRIKEILCYTGPLHNVKKIKEHHKEAKELIICNKKIYKDLLKIGMKPQKTFNCSFPILDEDMKSHFLRGYFDGDGCIHYNKKYKLAEAGFIGTNEFCRQSIIFLKEKEIFSYLDHNIRCDKRIGYIRIRSKKEIKKFSNFIYKNASIYLERKYKIFLENDLL